jgi:hypothetical protein
LEDVEELLETMNLFEITENKGGNKDDTLEKNVETESHTQFKGFDILLLDRLNRCWLIGTLFGFDLISHVCCFHVR